MSKKAQNYPEKDIRSPSPFLAKGISLFCVHPGVVPGRPYNQRERRQRPLHHWKIGAPAFSGGLPLIIGIKKIHITASGHTYPTVFSISLAPFMLPDISKIGQASILAYDLGRVISRFIIHNNDFKILKGLF